MSHLNHNESSCTSPLDHGWELASTPANAVVLPQNLPPTLEWLTATVPGTVAQTLRAAHRWSLDSPTPLHDRDYWYRTRLQQRGKRTLRFGGLATIAQVWLNGRLILESSNMFLAHSVEVELSGDDELIVCFRSLNAHLETLRPPRARWRPRMIVPANLRTVRTTVLGHMPGWCPPVDIVGPWRAIELEIDSPLRLSDAQVNALLTESGQGVLRVKVPVAPECNRPAMLECAGARTSMQISDGSLCGELIIDAVTAWWPHTHGDAALHEVQLRVDSDTIDLGRVGFRRIDIDRGLDGREFRLKINGESIFCRGACWSSADIVGSSHARADFLPWLQAMREANMNMVRVGGTMVYEADAFYQLCDELGLLVWQDFMFANFDYPVTDAQFERSVREEATQFLKRTSRSPSLAVLCGGSEVSQQASMLGLKREHWSSLLFDAWLPDAVARWRADVPYVTNTPSGGDLPFVANAGVTHYYGVGAYMRPFEDVRRADVRFASECLAFANVPEQRTLERELCVSAVHHPRWKERVPRDNGASWDFEDVRDYYFQYLYGLDPARLRREDEQRYLELSRAVTGEVMETVFAEWRRKGSSCNGGLVWYFQDLWPGAGWGVVDSTGEPKPAWCALRRALRPMQLIMTDEGINGLVLHVINESASERAAKLELACWDDGTLVLRGEREVTLASRATMQLAATEIIGVFFDVTYAYRFGAPGHTLVAATLTDAASGKLIADSYYFPQGRDVHTRDMEIQVELAQDPDGWILTLQTDLPALSVHIEDEYFRPEDNWFHLAPKTMKCVRLVPRSSDAASPHGEVKVLNCRRAYRYG